MDPKVPMNTGLFPSRNANFKVTIPSDFQEKYQDKLSQNNWASGDEREFFQNMKSLADQAQKIEKEVRSYATALGRFDEDPRIDDECGSRGNFRLSEPLIMDTNTQARMRITEASLRFDTANGAPLSFQAQGTKYGDYVMSPIELTRLSLDGTNEEKVYEKRTRDYRYLPGGGYREETLSQRVAQTKDGRIIFEQNIKKGGSSG